MRAWAALGLGSNLGDRMGFLQLAMEEIQTRYSILATSPVYETEPWGVQHQQPYLNAALLICGDFSPLSLLIQTQEWERRLGRLSKEDYLPRTVDIDVLYLGTTCLESPGLTLPHPRIHERRFVLQPLADLMPGFPDPRVNQTIQHLYQACPDKSWIRVAGHLKIPKTIGANREIE